MTSQDELKRQAAEHAVAEIRDGMVVGLGTGSTAKLAVDAIGRRVREEGIRILGIPTSERTAAQAAGLGIPLTDFGAHDSIDLTIDGADAVERGTLALIKGLGGALLREKIVASSSRQMTVIVDESKLRGPLGSFCPVPVEVTRFGWQATRRKLAGLCRMAVLRMAAGGETFVTDGGNHIVDCDFGPIADAAAVERSLKSIAGVVETGLFVAIATKVIVASSGGIEVLNRTS
ncbi:MAG TPA: ribose-5-phosphate isomerase RpiA [Stellaceae bacterium]|nr:ribose-5-phosphate isomerase RpiA [Stellaceae bacterium]